MIIQASEHSSDPGELPCMKLMLQTIALVRPPTILHPFRA
jgi:hypothetical protein